MCASILVTGAKRACKRSQVEMCTVEGSGIGCPSSCRRFSIRSRWRASPSAISRMTCARRVSRMRSARIVYTAPAPASPRQASWSRATGSADRAVELGSAEMRNHFAKARVLKRDLDPGQVRTHPLAALLDDPLKRLLVETSRHGDQLVGAGCDHVVAEEPRLFPQLVGPVFVYQAHGL